MSCLEVKTLEEAKVNVPSSILPVQGLRRDNDGILTEDSLRTIVDGLKSRSIDPTTTASKKEIMSSLSTLLCSVNNQYQFLMKELVRLVGQQAPIEKEFLNILKEKNLFMLDILTVSRHIESIPGNDMKETFIEGWQVAGNSTGVKPRVAAAMEGFQDTLAQHRDMFEKRSFEELQKQMVKMTSEKNKVASNYLGLYGFLNIVAVGLLIYVAGVSSSAK